MSRENIADRKYASIKECKHLYPDLADCLRNISTDRQEVGYIEGRVDVLEDLVIQLVFVLTRNNVIHDPTNDCREAPKDV